jgi:hypothetical protein
MIHMQLLQTPQPPQPKKIEYYKEGRITVIEGPQRSGKTLGMSILALDEYIACRQPVITNIAYEAPDTGLVKIPYKPLNFFELTMEKIGTFTNRPITIDELNFYLDSRGSMTKINRRFCQWLLQSKKMGINTYGTTHNLGYLDLRFRENFDFLVQPTTIYQTIWNEVLRIEERKPALLVMKWFNGPNQKHFRRTITIDFRKKPQLLGMYNSRHVFNPFAEMEEQMELEKLQKKAKGKLRASSLKNLVPEHNPFDTAIGAT